ncbi:MULTISPECIES: DUF3025 domain-containing protein [Rhodanobacter]|uniref:DUF3025 domain-containing protein n=1 Tax=Rhodanobacter TaxID=75309 RepID=UPI00042817E1|nr:MULTISPECIES: DUF3025 domain-containing protein [Rhodanobacter]KZC18642.1 hypothetical protein RHOFW104R3_35415 [Rhodanobacter denitrificans]UJJ52368.1 DUF3025 domain-containing protein [Rhodanobacter denitrificans]UJM95121.1 DUF3025 domain-containing protein [Rhodanobacter denitrificans]UJM98652.1 DUF3025 domain-containing protein [Rhodanobacter denitrificans]UJN21933.1 DUF3025 domain-containing protein [Rhodanobacter denitrificans]
MRYVAPARDAVDPAVFGRLPLAAWREHAGLIEGRDWPAIDALNACRPAGMPERFVAQTHELLADGLHYEQRVAERGAIATRERNWHDLFNALVWLRHPAIKRALNARQVGEIARMGPKQRSRAQYALTHFDEAGVVVAVRDPALLALWDAHDWHGLFWRRRQAWLDGTIRLELFGHALLELALSPGRLLVGKALVFQSDSDAGLPAPCATAIGSGRLLLDPLELRPLPLSGIPGWHPDNADEAFHRHAACYQPRRAGRAYPPASPIP